MKQLRFMVWTLAVAGAICLVPLLAQTITQAPASFPPGLTVPSAVVPASAVNGGGTVVTPAIYFPNGSASAPSIAFASQPNTGWYHRVSSEMTLAANGVAAMGLDGDLTLVAANGLKWNSGTSIGAGVDTTLVRLAPGVIAPGANFAFGLTAPAFVRTAPTISSGFGSSPSIVASNGTAAFTINVGTGGSATSGVVGLPTATTGWNCFANDITAAAAHVAYNTRQTASSTTTATLENQTTSTGAAIAWGASDILRVNCVAY